jgi:hypothetical protein
MTDERPVHVTLNGPEITCTPLTDEEWEVHKARQAADEAATAARADQNAAEHALILEKAAQDPVFAILARRLGYNIPEGGTDGTGVAPAAPASVDQAPARAGDGGGPAPDGEPGAAV